MSFITNRVNLFLLGSMILASLGLVSTTVYFSYVLEKYSIQTGNLEDLKNEIIAKQKFLEQIKKELSMRTKTKEDFFSKYLALKKEYDYYKNKVDGLELLNRELSQRNKKLELLNGDLSRVNNQLRENMEFIVYEKESCQQSLKDLSETLASYRARCP